jgi:hypothetical protein
VPAVPGGDGSGVVCGRTAAGTAIGISLIKAAVFPVFSLRVSLLLTLNI